MQTFMPFRSYPRSAKTLDNLRLGKQIIEAGQIMRAIEHGPLNGWSNHPAVIQWRGYKGSLLIYTYAMSKEWYIRRGKVHGSWKRTREEQDKLWNMILVSGKMPKLPEWVGDPRYHMSHQSNLFRKDPIYYGVFFPAIADNPDLQDLEYFWPSKEGYNGDT